MKYWLWLDQIPGLGPVTAKTLLKTFKTPQAIYKCNYDDFITIPGIGPKLAKTLVESKSFDHVYKTLRTLKKGAIKLLTFHDPLYPSWAKDHHKAPILLYYKGDLSPLTNTIAITGNYTISHDSRRLLDRDLPLLIKANQTIVTGLNHGVDAFVIKKALEYEGKVLVFLPYGLDMCSPKALMAFKKSILRKVVFISEYPLGSKPLKAFYLKTQTLMASWAHQLLILEANHQHPCQRLAQIFHQLNKKVNVMPHSLFLDHSKGSNHLLSTIGHCYTQPQQVLTEKPFSNEKTLRIPIKEKQTLIKASSTEDKILEFLKEKPQCLEDISKHIHQPVLKTHEILTIMELTYNLKALPGNRYSRY